MFLWYEIGRLKLGFSNGSNLLSNIYLRHRPYAITELLKIGQTVVHDLSALALAYHKIAQK